MKPATTKFVNRAIQPLITIDTYQSIKVLIASTTENTVYTSIHHTLVARKELQLLNVGLISVTVGFWMVKNIFKIKTGKFLFFFGVSIVNSEMFCDCYSQQDSHLQLFQSFMSLKEKQIICPGQNETLLMLCCTKNSSLIVGETVKIFC